MPDISMCVNKSCPLRTKCYRFMAEPNKYRQSYMGFKPDKKGDCENFWEMEKT